MKKILTFCALALAFAVSITLAACPEVEATYGWRGIGLKNTTAYQEVFDEEAPTAGTSKTFICTKAELDSYFVAAKTKMSATAEETPQKGLSLSDVGNMLQTAVTKGNLSAEKKTELLNALESGKSVIYTAFFVNSSWGNTWEINGFYKE